MNFRHPMVVLAAVPPGTMHQCNFVTVTQLPVDGAEATKGESNFPGLLHAAWEPWRVGEQPSRPVRARLSNPGVGGNQLLRTRPQTS